MSVVTRFAPSPTGLLHIGNLRTAFINWLYSKQNNGKFILRIDDTDEERSRQEYIDAIFKDCEWLGLSFDLTFRQSQRADRYKEVIDKLIADGRLYPCYETPEELELNRKMQLSNSKPPIYNRAALRLTSEEINEHKKMGRKPCYRFLMDYSNIAWQDFVKGSISFEGNNISDPIVLKENGNITYLLCSVIDDIDYNISTIIRGEDHVINTAVQIQMIQALNGTNPLFGHLSLIKSKEAKISKRAGGFDITSLRDELKIEPLVLWSFLSTIGTSLPIKAYDNIDDIIKDFDIKHFSSSPSTYMEQELQILNHKFITHLSYDAVQSRLKDMNIAKEITEDFWLSIRGNLDNIAQVIDWYKICKQDVEAVNVDKEYLRVAASMLPEGPIDNDTFKAWMSIVAGHTNRKGKDLFLPIRIALTGGVSGPELHNLLPIIGREKILYRLQK